MTPSAYPPNAPPGSAPYPTTQGAPLSYPGGPNTGPNATPGYPTQPYPGGPNTAPNVAPGFLLLLPAPTQGQAYPYPSPQVSLEFGVDNGRIKNRNKIQSVVRSRWHA